MLTSGTNPDYRIEDTMRGLSITVGLTLALAIVVSGCKRAKPEVAVEEKPPIVVAAPSSSDGSFKQLDKKTSEEIGKAVKELVNSPGEPLSAKDKAAGNPLTNPFDRRQ